MRTQFSTGCAQITLDQIKTLVENFGYSQRELFTLAIEQFYNSKFATNNPIKTNIINDGIWPQNPISSDEIKSGMKLLFPSGDSIYIGTVECIEGDRVLLSGGYWCYSHEMSRITENAS